MSNPYLIKTVKCAHCGKPRQETNHWFVLEVAGGRFRCRPLSPRDPVADAAPYCNDATLRLTKSEEPVCGQQCAQKLFARYLAGEMTRRPAGTL